MITVGGFVTCTVCEVLTIPHEFVSESFMVYIPGVTKLNEGFTEFLSVGVVKLHVSGAVPQFPGE